MTRPKKSLQIKQFFKNSPDTNLHFNFNPKIVLPLLSSTEAEISSAEEQLIRNTLIRYGKLRISVLSFFITNSVDMPKKTYTLVSHVWEG